MRLGVAGSVKREALMLVLAVLAVDVVFVGISYLAHLGHASNAIKVAFTAAWTLVTLAVVIRALSRIRSARLHRKSA
jgi:tellurite resistance protein TehA-like permease